MVDLEASNAKRGKRSREQILVTVHTVEEEYMILDTCCCCIPLKCGCYLIALVNLVGVIAGFISSGAFIWAGLKLVNPETKDSQEAISLACYVIGITLLLVAFSMIPLLIPGLIFNFMLLVGLYKNKPLNLKGYVLYSGIFLILWTLVALMGGVTIIILLFVILEYYFTVQIYFSITPSRVKQFREVDRLDLGSTLTTPTRDPLSTASPRRPPGVNAASTGGRRVDAGWTPRGQPVDAARSTRERRVTNEWTPLIYEFNSTIKPFKCLINS